MKKIIINFLFVLFAVATAFAQQQPQNTQFFYYKLGYNPAYAGSQENTCISCIYRNQWLGLDGAPKTMAITFNMPLFNQRVGIGAVDLHFLHERETHAKLLLSEGTKRLGALW